MLLVGGAHGPYQCTCQGQRSHHPGQQGQGGELGLSCVPISLCSLGPTACTCLGGILCHHPNSSSTPLARPVSLPLFPQQPVLRDGKFPSVSGTGLEIFSKYVSQEPNQCMCFFFQCWSLNPALCECWASTLPLSYTQCWLGYVNVTQARVIWEEGVSTDKAPP